ncbi:hypothetical protein [Streptomyces agglomeratus]|uniref:hypothetical protein n=1 Tax=Streptomyces agglomeratus TaxID=285458 RepID=UPI00210A2623|nr:hypothetical protein [Streptomyces agglomeratus]
MRASRWEERVPLSGVPVVNVAKAAGLAVSACGARVRPGPVPAQREETGTHPKPKPVTTGRQAGISAL